MDFKLNEICLGLKFIVPLNHSILGFEESHKGLQEGAPVPATSQKNELLKED